MANSQHSYNEPGPDAYRSHEDMDTSLASALSSGNTALVLTLADGTVRRVSCPVSRDRYQVATLLRGRHITAPFVEEERAFIRSLLDRISSADMFSMSSIPVKLNGQSEQPVFLSVSTIMGEKSGSFLVAWKFSPTRQEADPNPDDKIRRLQKRIEILESRYQTQQRVAELTRGALVSARKANRTLSRALSASRDLRRQQADAFRQSIEQKDELIERSRELHALANSARRNAEQARDRLAYLADATWALSESLDMEATLQRIVERIVPSMADCCVVALLDDERDTLVQVAAASDDDEIRRAISEVGECHFRNLDPTHPVRRAMLSGHPSVVHDVSAPQSTTTSDLRDMYSHAGDLGLTAYIVAPLRSRDRVFGTLTIASTRHGHRFQPEDLQFIEDIALRAAQALDNALLFSDVQEASKNSERYLSIASHELRSPLAVVSGFGSLLLRHLENPEPDREKINSIGNEMQRGIERLEMLTANLLTSAALHTHGSGVDFQRVNGARLIRKLIDQINVIWAVNGNHRVRVEGPTVLHCRWNIEGIERAVENVVSNALKYSDPDSPVVVEIREDGDNAVITVRDQGIGMTRDEVADLYTPFSRGQMARATAVGTGLGMYISQQIVNQHGGTIDVQSEPGVGSEFTITLPCVPPEDSDDAFPERQ